MSDAFFNTSPAISIKVAPPMSGQVAEDRGPEVPKEHGTEGLRRRCIHTTHLDALFEMAPSCVLLLTRAGEILDINPAGLLSFDLDHKSQIVGKPLAQFCLPEHYHALVAFLDAVTRGEAKVLLHETLGARGRRRWFDSRATLVDDTTTMDQKNILLVSTDITEKQQLIDLLMKSETRYRAVTADQSELIARWHPAKGISFINDAAQRYVGDDINELVQFGFWNFVVEEDKPKLKQHLDSLSPQSPLGSVIHRLCFTNQGERWTQWTNRALFDESENLIEVHSVGRDITEQYLATEKLQKELEHKEILLRELHHRVKNNLQIVASLLAIQANSAASPLQSAFNDARSRVLAMSLVHELLYQNDSPEIDIHSYTIQLARSLLASFGANRVNLLVDAEPKKHFLDLDRAIPLGLIMNELFTNSLKHAFGHPASGTITVRMNEFNGKLIFEFSDNGVGFNESLVRPTSLGLKLLPRLAAQLGARMTRLVGPGTIYQLEFEKTAP